jgi:hypothetical protein
MTISLKVIAQFFKGDVGVHVIGKESKLQTSQLSCSRLDVISCWTTKSGRLISLPDSDHFDSSQERSCILLSSTQRKVLYHVYYCYYCWIVHDCNIRLDREELRSAPSWNPIHCIGLSTMIKIHFSCKFGNSKKRSNSTRPCKKESVDPLTYASSRVRLLMLPKFIFIGIFDWHIRARIPVFIRRAFPIDRIIARWMVTSWMIPSKDPKIRWSCWFRWKTLIMSVLKCTFFPWRSFWKFFCAGSRGRKNRVTHPVQDEAIRPISDILQSKIHEVISGDCDYLAFWLFCIVH